MAERLDAERVKHRFEANNHDPRADVECIEVTSPLGGDTVVSVTSSRLTEETVRQITSRLTGWSLDKDVSLFENDPEGETTFVISEDVKQLSNPD